MRKTRILLNKRVYLGLSILDLSKTLSYELWHDYVKPNYDENAKRCYMDTDGYGYSFIVHVNTDNIYQDITKDVKARFEFYIRQTIAMRKK